MKEKCGKSLLKRLWSWLAGSKCGGCTGCSCSRCAGKRRCAVGEEVTLDALGIGQTGEVVEVAGGDQDMVNRFADHGLVRGIKVSVHEQALFGGPMLVQVQGTMMALRRREAQLIRIKLLSV